MALVNEQMAFPGLEPGPKEVALTAVGRVLLKHRVVAKELREDGFGRRRWVKRPGPRGQLYWERD